MLLIKIEGETERPLEFLNLDQKDSLSDYSRVYEIE